jgi:hypothetical protein
MMARTSLVMVGLAIALAVARAHAGQHDTHQPAAGNAQADARVAQCRQVQPQVAATIAAALTRLDESRQANSPTAMRAAVDDAQAALLDVRAQLAPCAEAQPSSSAPPHAEHSGPTGPTSK